MKTLIERLLNWQREMERSSDALRAQPGGNIPGTELYEAAEGSGAVAESLEDAIEEIVRQAEEITELRRVLAQYGRHSSTCAINHYFGYGKPKCTCGWDKVRQILDKEDIP